MLCFFSPIFTIEFVYNRILMILGRMFWQSMTKDHPPCYTHMRLPRNVKCHVVRLVKLLTAFYSYKDNIFVDAAAI